MNFTRCAMFACDKQRTFVLLKQRLFEWSNLFYSKLFAQDLSSGGTDVRDVCEVGCRQIYGGNGIKYRGCNGAVQVRRKTGK